MSIESDCPKSDANNILVSNDCRRFDLRLLFISRRRFSLRCSTFISSPSRYADEILFTPGKLAPHLNRNKICPWRTTIRKQSSASANTTKHARQNNWQPDSNTAASNTIEAFSQTSLSRYREWVAESKQCEYSTHDRQKTNHSRRAQLLHCAHHDNKAN